MAAALTAAVEDLFLVAPDGVVVVLEAAAEVVASAVVLEVEVSVGVAQAETGSVC